MKTENLIPRDYLETIEETTTFAYSNADGGNIGGYFNNNFNYLVWIVQDEDNGPYWVYVDYVGEEEEDSLEVSYFDVEVDNITEVLETLAELETLIPEME